MTRVVQEQRAYDAYYGKFAFFVSLLVLAVSTMLRPYLFGFCAAAAACYICTIVFGVSLNCFAA